MFSEQTFRKSLVLLYVFVLFSIGCLAQSDSHNIFNKTLILQITFNKKIFELTVLFFNQISFLRKSAMLY